MEFRPPDPTIDLHWDRYRGAIYDIFAANARKFPNRICVTEIQCRHQPQRQWTYGQIHTASSQLASRLLASNCQVGDDLVVAYLGALKAGATVSVLDPQYPPERHIVLLNIARPRFVINIQRAIDEFPMSQSVKQHMREQLDLRTCVISKGRIDSVSC